MTSTRDSNHSLLCCLLFLAGLIGLFALPAHCEADDGTAMYRADSRHSGVYHSVRSKQASPGNTPVRWSFKLSDMSESVTPTVCDGMVYMADYDSLYAIELQTGKLVWKFAVPGSKLMPFFKGSSTMVREPRMFGCPAVSNGVVYCLGSNNVLYGFDAKSGRMSWKWDHPESYLEAFPSVAGNLLVIGSEMVGTSPEDTRPTPEKNLYALDLKKQKVMWKALAREGDPGASAAIGDQTIFWAGHDGLKAIRANDGAVLWQQPSLICSGSPSYQDKVLYCAGRSSGALYAIDAVTGKQLWIKTAKAGEFTDCAVTSDAIYTCESGDRNQPGNLYALNPKSGSVIWKYPTQAVSIPTVMGELVLICAGDDGISAFDRKTGKLRWRYQGYGSMGLNDSIAAGDGLLFCCDRFPSAPRTDAPRLFAVDIKSAEQYWLTHKQSKPGSRAATKN